MESPRQELFSLTQGYKTTQALYVAAKLGVADHLRHGTKNAEELAKEVEANPKALFRLMRHLAAIGVFTQDESGKFGLTPLGELLCTDNPESMRYGAIFTGEENYKAAGNLLHSVRTGETAFNNLYGKGHFDWMAEHADASSTFNKAMAQSLRRQANPVESYDYSGKRLVVDVGGGRGDLISLKDPQKPGQFCRPKGSRTDVISRRDPSSIPYPQAETSTCYRAFSMIGQVTKQQPF